MFHGTKLKDGGLGVFGVDNTEIDIEAEGKSLFSSKKCPTLKNKPKLFFVDACWVEKHLDTTNSISSKSSDIPSTSHFRSNANISRTALSKNSDMSDFLFSFSTLPNYVSLRDTNYGNWFIQEFTSALDEFAETRTLSDIMNKVRQKLMRKTTKHDAQMSVDHWMLSRHVLFKYKEKKIVCSSSSDTYLLGVNEKKEAPYYFGGDRNIQLLNIFDCFPFLTQTGKSCRFASLDSDLKSICIWRILDSKKKNLHVLEGHSHEVTALHSFEAEHNNEITSLLASGSKDGSIRIWRVASGEFLQLFMGHEQKVVSFESIGTRKLASSSLDGTIRVWDLSFHFQFVLPETQYKFTYAKHNTLQIPRTKMFVLVVGELIQVYDSKSGALKRTIQPDQFINDSKLVGEHQIAIAANQIIQIFDLKKGTLEKSLKNEAP